MAASRVMTAWAASQHRDWMGCLWAVRLVVDPEPSDTLPAFQGKVCSPNLCAVITAVLHRMLLLRLHTVSAICN